MRRHLWTLAIAFTLLQLTPRDAIVFRYNARQILAGNPAPSVQITVQPISAEGWLQMEPLFTSDNEVVREGVKAMLAEHVIALRGRAEPRHWTRYQMAEENVLERFKESPALFPAYDDDSARNAARERFVKYAYRWF
jgi:hypothetical protein